MDAALDAIQFYLAQQYPKIVKAKQTVKWVNAACIALWVFEYLEMLPLEIQFVWPRKATAVNVLFYLLRYLPFVHLSLSLLFFTAVLPFQVCKPYFICVASLIVFSILFAEAIMFIRLYAIGGRTPAMKFYTITHFTLAAVAISTLWGKFLSTLQYTTIPLYHQNLGCTSLEDNGTFLSSAYGVVLFNELVVAILTVIIGCKKYKELKNVPLFRILYLDGTLYFIVLAGLSMSNILINLVIQRELTYPVSLIQYVLHNIFAIRMTLHLRQVAHVEVADSPSHQPSGQSPAQFQLQPL